MGYLCFKNSSIDVDVHLENKNSFDTLDLIHKHLVNTEAIHLKSIKINNDKIICKINDINFVLTSLSHSNCYRTSRLFHFYSKLDSRFKILSFCFHYLAKV